MAPAFATLTAGASACKTAWKAVITGIGPAAPATSTDKDDGLRVYSRAAGEGGASGYRAHRDGAAPCLSERRAAKSLTSPSISSSAAAGTRVSAVSSDSGTISYTRVSVLQLGGSGDVSGDMLDSERHFQAMMRYVAGCIAVRLRLPR